MTRPYEGLRVLDFSRFLPAAYVTWVLADLGADVIRIENPREIAKSEAMFAAAGEDAAAARRRRARPSYTRGKRSLLLDIGHGQAASIIDRLASDAALLVEDYRPGVLAGLGLGPEMLCAAHPGLVYASVSFAGQTGPLAGKAGHDPAALALAGALSRLNGRPGPSLPGLQVADVLTGAHATIAVQAALAARAATGRGQRVDVAMSDASMALLLVTLGRTDAPETLPPPGAWHPKGGVWRCADGRYLCTTDMEPRYWQRFCAAIGRPDFAALQHAADRHPEMQRTIAAIIATRGRDDWVALLGAADTQAMPVLSVAEALDHPHNRARGMIVETPLPDQPPVTQLALPFHLSETSPVSPRAAGLPGEDGAAVLAEAGLGADEIAALAAAGLFGAARP